MALLTVQLFGTKKCPHTRAAERFFKERSVAVHAVDLANKGMSAGELRNVAARAGGMEALIDRDGKRYVDKGLKIRGAHGPAHREDAGRRSAAAAHADRALRRARHGRLCPRGMAELDRRSAAWMKPDPHRKEIRLTVMQQAQETPIVCVRGGAARRIEDNVAIERALEIRVRIDGSEQVLTTTMRTPGEDEWLAAGFLHAEAIVRDASELLLLESVSDDAVVVELARARRRRSPPASAGFVTSAACGVCGRSSLDGMERLTRLPRAYDHPRLSHAVIHGLPARAARRAGDVRAHGRAARGGPVLDGGRVARRARGRRPPQRGRQAGRAHCCWPAGCRPRSSC